MAIGVLTEKKTKWNFAVDYFKNGDSNGAINYAVSNIVEELENFWEKAKSQAETKGLRHWTGKCSEPLANRRGIKAKTYLHIIIVAFFSGTFLLARYNLGHDVPFEPYTNGIVSYTEISPAYRGAIRPTWELLYAHYAQIKTSRVRRQSRA
ncbi:hypothetical protein EDB80DRAFT_872703 [Ilyonectria destructans]|nr:hypothetical protein EDB80DRAFT_872703 [Ilyonectria destructans]